MPTVLVSYRCRGWCRGRRLLPLDRCPHTLLVINNANNSNKNKILCQQYYHLTGAGGGAGAAVCFSKGAVLDTYLLLPCYYLPQNLLQLTNSNLSFSLSLFHHITFITKPLHNYIIGLISPIMAFVHISITVLFFCFCVFRFCVPLSFLFFIFPV
jgi:hypothetical protein